jgi:hypothetical protein
MQYGVCVYFPYPYTAEKKNAGQKEEMIFFYLVVSIVSVHESYTGSHPHRHQMTRLPQNPRRNGGKNKNQIHRDNPHKMPPIHSIIIFYQTNISKGLRRFQIENERIVQSSGFQHLRKEKEKTGRISSLRCEEAIKKRPPCYSHVILYNLLYTFLSFLLHGNNTQGTTAAL